MFVSLLSGLGADPDAILASINTVTAAGVRNPDA
jgi:hypothetical protein